MIDRKNIPVVVECYADNGEHSHFKLIDVETGYCLWEESETAPNSDYAKRLQSGRDYLMQVEPNKITVENCLEAFGWTKNGF